MFRLISFGDEVIIPKKIDLIFDDSDYILHKVKRKQTLIKISNLYDVDVNLIKNFNNLSSDKLDKGTSIKIPLIPLSEGSIKEIPNRVKYYLVKQKEGKWRIAYKYGITVDQLELINPQIGTFLKVSEKILVPNINLDKLNVIDENYAYYKVLPKEGFYRLKIKLGIRRIITIITRHLNGTYTLDPPAAIIFSATMVGWLIRKDGVLWISSRNDASERLQALAITLKYAKALDVAQRLQSGGVSSG